MTLIIDTFVFRFKIGYYMLGLIIWLIVILLICFSVSGWHTIIFYAILLPFLVLLFFLYVDFPENRFNTERFKSDIKYLLNKLHKK